MLLADAAATNGCGCQSGVRICGRTNRHQFNLNTNKVNEHAGRYAENHVDACVGIYTHMQRMVSGGTVANIEGKNITHAACIRASDITNVFYRAYGIALHHIKAAGSGSTLEEMKRANKLPSPVPPATVYNCCAHRDAGESLTPCPYGI